VVETIKRFNHCRTSLQHQCLLKSGEPFIDLGNSEAPAALLDCIFIVNKWKVIIFLFSFNCDSIKPTKLKASWFLRETKAEDAPHRSSVILFVLTPGTGIYQNIPTQDQIFRLIRMPAE